MLIVPNPSHGHLGATYLATRIQREGEDAYCKRIPEFSHLSLKVRSTITAFRIDRILDE